MNFYIFDTNKIAVLKKAHLQKTHKLTKSLASLVGLYSILESIKNGYSPYKSYLWTFFKEWHMAILDPLFHVPYHSSPALNQPSFALSGSYRSWPLLALVTTLRSKKPGILLLKSAVCTYRHAKGTYDSSLHKSCSAEIIKHLVNISYEVGSKLEDVAAAAIHVDLCLWET